MCEHGRRRTRCRQCGGGASPGSMCEHNRRRTHCNECGGGCMCEHGRRRTRCRQCGGGSICEHGRHRVDCCGPTTSKRDLRYAATRRHSDVVRGAVLNTASGGTGKCECADPQCFCRRKAIAMARARYTVVPQNFECTSRATSRVRSCPCWFCLSSTGPMVRRPRTCLRT